MSLSDADRDELRSYLKSHDDDLVERWIEHVDIQLRIATELQNAPMPSDHADFLKQQLGRLDKGLQGLLALWSDRDYRGRVNIQRTIGDTKEPRASELIGANNEYLNRAFRLWRDLVALRQDIESSLPPSDRRGRKSGDRVGLRAEIAAAYEWAGFGSRDSDDFRIIADIIWPAEG